MVLLAFTNNENNNTNNETFYIQTDTISRIFPVRDENNNATGMFKISFTDGISVDFTRKDKDWIVAKIQEDNVNRNQTQISYLNSPSTDAQLKIIDESIKKNGRRIFR